MLGYDVCLIERHAFPRRHLGESLTPGVLPLLEATGARGAVERAGFVRAPRVDVMWDEGPRTRLDPNEEGVLVDRGAFDLLLLQRAAHLGVRVLQPAQPRAWVHDDRGWHIRVSTDSGERVVRARLLAEATGRSQMRASRRRITGVRTMALSAYWRGTSLPETPRIEAGADGWFWRVPLPDGTCNTLVFVDPDSLRHIRGRRLDPHMDALLATSSLLPRRAEWHRDGPVRAVDATASVNLACIDAHSIAVGDAALALDPLSSSGVQKAIQTALAGAVVVNTLLRRPASSALADAFYRDSLHAAAERHRRWAASHYAKMRIVHDTPFWRRRAEAAEPEAPPADAPRAPSPDAPLVCAPGAAFALRPTLDADFVVEREVVTLPALVEPLAFLGGVHVAPLLRALPTPLSADAIAVLWSTHLPPPTARALVRWLIAHGVLVEGRS